MRALPLRRGPLARALVLAIVVIGTVAASVSPAVASGPATLGVSGWQVYPTTAIYDRPAGVPFRHGHPGEYAAAPATPAQNDAGWADCGPGSPSRTSPYNHAVPAGVSSPICPNPTTIGMGIGSILPVGSCWGKLNFTYFQALVSIPAGTTISTFEVRMRGADDGARISLVNSFYPAGVTPAGGYIWQDTPQATGNLAAYVVAGEINRVVITQVDDCPTGNNLIEAQIFLNGTVIPPAPADTTPPSAAPVVSPAANGAGWHSSDVTVDWNWTDGGSGIDPANCVQSSASSGEGAITLTAACSDIAGNSASDSVTVNVDKTRPVVSYSGNAGTYSVNQTVSISCSAGDALSGVAADTCADVSAPAWQLGLGVHTYSATATDAAGNTGTGSASFTVTVDATSLCALVRLFAAKNGIANSLCVKLDAAAAAAARGQAKTKANILSAFDAEVRAQSGKALTAQQAALLRSFAATL